ncbi:MAG TPA: response regulator [Candidatus Binatia bacterium]|nr:response regulator [Candidatus Binatia bacterium]
MMAARILLAEDESAVAGPLLSALRERGHEVRWVRAVRDLRTEMPEFSPQVLLLDSALDQDALEYLQAIRFTPLCPPGGVVVLTDPGDHGSRERAHQLGAAAVVPKSQDPVRLVGVVEELIGYL